MKTCAQVRIAGEGRAGLVLAASARHRARCVGQAVGIKEVERGICLVSWMDYDLGYIELEEKTLHPLDIPFDQKVLPM